MTGNFKVSRSNVQVLLVLLLFIAPTLVLMGLMTRESLQNRQEAVFVLPIKGYDPRDLLYGHYFTFQIDWPLQATQAEICSDDSISCRACFQVTDPGQPGRPALRVVPEAQIAGLSCAATLGNIDYFLPPAVNLQTGAVDAGHIIFRDAPTRFYIDERDGAWLDKTFRSRPEAFSIAIRIANDRIVLDELLVDGRDYKLAPRD